MRAQIKTSQATITFPLTALRYRHKRNARNKKVIFEVDIQALRKVNNPKTIDDMVAQARLEYFSGQTKGFTDAQKLMDYLHK